MKKGIEWLAEMAHQHQVLFLKRLSEWDNYAGAESIAGYLNYEYDSFSQFISGGFTWLATPEGHDYWHDIAHQIK